MAKVNNLLAERFKQATQKLSKMTNLAQMSSSGNLSSFSGIFRVAPLSQTEEQSLQELLTTYGDESQNIQQDLLTLISITSEVRAISNQAAILHGERIKKAQEILKGYRDGAFSSWLIGTYGNRQTPYNFLQYYELYMALPQQMHSKLDEMPRQAVYALASRDAPLDQKKELIENYRGEAKTEILSLIRKTFPLPQHDKRRENLAENAIELLSRLESLMKTSRFKTTATQKAKILRLIENIQLHLGT